MCAEQGLCVECGYIHEGYISCYGAAKQRFADETGLDFWTRQEVKDGLVNKHVSGPSRNNES